MTIICCYTELHPATSKALELYAQGAELVELPADDTHAYWKALDSHWDDIDDLIIIEHDIEITGMVIPSFDACGNPWCTFPYLHRDGTRMLNMSLGCTKLSWVARREAPPDEIAKVHVDCWSCNVGAQMEGLPACWQHIDAKLACLLEHKGIHPCIHEPAVTHHDQAEIC